PALDQLAQQGNYFPIAHTPASLCAPSLATIMTGLNLGDHVRDEPVDASAFTTSPVIPEWLPGYGAPDFNDNTTYMTMGAGKWQCGCSHHDDWGSGTSCSVDKRPFDRDIPSGDPSSGGGIRAAVLKPYHPKGPNPDQMRFDACCDLAMQAEKEFIDCDLCAVPSVGHDRSCPIGTPPNVHQMLCLDRANVCHRPDTDSDPQ